VKAWRSRRTPAKTALSRLSSAESASAASKPEANARIRARLQACRKARHSMRLQALPKNVERTLPVGCRWADSRRDVCPATQIHPTPTPTRHGRASLQRRVKTLKERGFSPKATSKRVPAHVGRTLLSDAFITDCVNASYQGTPSGLPQEPSENCAFRRCGRAAHSSLRLAQVGKFQVRVRV